MGCSTNSKKNKGNYQEIQVHSMTSKTHGPDRRNDKSEYQKRTCEMDKSLNRGMCIKFESRKICIACNHFDNSDLEIHNAEHKKLPD